MIRLRDGLGAVAFLAVLLATVPGYDRVFADPDWQAPVLATTLVAVGGVLVLRLLRVPGGLALPLSAGLGVASATWLLLPADAGWPTAARLAELTTLAATGLEELAVTPAPAPSLPGLVLLTGLAFHVVTVVALELVVRWQRPGLALGATTALWAIPLAVPLPAGPPAAAALYLATAAALLLVAGDADDPDAEPTGVALVTGLGLAAVAIGVAVSAPGLLPGYGAQSWVSLSAGATAPRGYQPIVDVSQRLRQPEERDLLRVRTPVPTYLRLAGLDSFDGSTWRLGPDGPGPFEPDPGRLFPADDLLPPESPAAVTEPLAVDVEVLELDNIYVPTPYQPLQVLGPERTDMVWSTEGGFLATWTTGADGQPAGPEVGIRPGVRYRVQAARPAPSYTELAAVDTSDPTLARWTALPREYPELAAEAEAVYAAAGATTTIDRALALQAWFIGTEAGFRYDLDVPALRGEDALERFVLTDRVGYCEYYATAMAVMLRATGIPARVAVGFLPGRVTTPADPQAEAVLTEHTVSTADAHAWVEVLFPGYGWITFEPTPRDDQSQLVPRPENLVPEETEAERAAREAAEAAEAAGDDPSEPTTPDVTGPDLEDLLPEEDLVPADGAGADVDAAAPWRWWLPLLVTAVALAAVLAAGGRVRGRAEARTTPTARVLAAQARLLATADALGSPRQPHETLAEAVRRWQDEGRLGQGPHRRAEAGRFVTVVQAAGFGGHLDEGDAVETVRLGSDLEDRLRATASLRQRRQAPVRRLTAPIRRWRGQRRTPGEDVQDAPQRVSATTARR